MARLEGTKRPIIVKKSPIVIVKSFIVLQLAAVGIFFFAGILTNYAKIYRSLPINHFLSFHLAEAILIFSGETAIVFFIFFRWYKEYYHIRQNEIIHARGILYRCRTSILLDHVTSITYNQGPLAKLTKYGTIKLGDQTQCIMAIKDVPNPQEHVDLILKLKKASSRQFRPDIANAALNIVELISKGEHDQLEFKSSFRWDARENRINKNLEKSIMKTVAAFLNSRGGHLIIGIDDTKNVLGLDPDYATLNRSDADGFENHFSHVFNSMIGAEFRQFVRTEWPKLNGKDCCLIAVSPAPKPAYLKTDNSEEFFIRTGNGTTSLKFSEADHYIGSHWKNELF